MWRLKQIEGTIKIDTVCSLHKYNLLIRNTKKYLAIVSFIAVCML